MKRNLKRKLIAATATKTAATASAAAMAAWLRKLESGLSIANRECVGCGGRIRKGTAPVSSGVPALGQLCGGCLREVPWIGAIACRRCGRAEACPDCARRLNPAIAANRSAVRYTPMMKEWLARYKYRGHERMTPVFARMLEYAFDRLGDEWRETGRHKAAVLLTAVPLSERRYRERGFNQAQAMAEGVSRRFRIPLAPLLTRNRHTEKQSYKSRRERMESLERAFAPAPGAERTIRRHAANGPLNIVITDDVYTTGSTLHQCGEAVRAAAPDLFVSGDIRIYGITWAR